MTQEEALSITKLGVNVFLTGERGAGKSGAIRTVLNNRRAALLRGGDYLQAL